MAYSLRLIHFLIPSIIALLLSAIAIDAAEPNNPYLIIPTFPSHTKRAPGNATGTTIVPPNANSNHWVDSWASMPQFTEPGNLPPAPFTTSSVVFANTTLRQTVRLTLGGGDLIRIRLSNAFGGSDLPITAVSIALPSGGVSGVSGVVDGTTQRVTFSGEASVVVPIGALVVSDPIRLGGGRDGVKAGSVLTVTIYTKDGQTTNSVTSHPGSRTTSWFARGDHVDALDLPAAAEGQVEGEAKAGVAHWYWLSAVEVWTSKRNSALVIVGDSITDGRGSTDNANNRWPDLLLNRRLASHRSSSIAVINQAAGGNRILNDGLGPNALGRIDRDVLSHSSVTHALIYIGVNDIGTSSTDLPTQTALASRLIWAFKQIAERLHARGIVVIGATITPFSGPGQGYTDANREETRKAVNTWITAGSTGYFDAVVDFDKILADPAKPEQLSPLYNGGDYLHPNVAGFQALVDNFPLEVLDRRL